MSGDRLSRDVVIKLFYLVLWEIRNCEQALEDPDMKQEDMMYVQMDLETAQDAADQLLSIICVDDELSADTFEYVTNDHNEAIVALGLTYLQPPHWN